MVCRFKMLSLRVLYDTVLTTHGISRIILLSNASDPSPKHSGIVLVTDIPAYIKDSVRALWYSMLFPNPTTAHLMLLTAPLLCPSFLALASHTQPETGKNQTHSEFLATCHKIAADISSASQVFFPRAQLIPLTCDPPKLMAHPSRSSVCCRHFALCLFQY